MDGMVQPVKVRPLRSKDMVTNTGRAVFSLAARSAARASWRSVMVSMKIRSAPARSPAWTASLKQS